MADSGDRDTVENAAAKLLAENPPATTSAADFLGAQFDAGLAWVHFDEGCGGLGVAPGLQAVVDDLLDEAGAPSPKGNYVGVHQGATVVHEFGTDAHKQLLRPAFTNEEFWCQLFSEPGAGSDLAGLATSAVRDGDEWIVNGQKVWTSYAHKARWAILLARTDPHVPKHRGLTFFLVDMHADGIEVRPIHQPDGCREFNEVFLSEVRVPDADRLGDIGHGWGVSVFMLGSEREGVSSRDHITPLLDAWRNRRELSQLEPVYRDRVARQWTANRTAELLTERINQAKGRGSESELAPLVKQASDFAAQHTAELAMDLLGAEATLGGNYDGVARGEEPSPQLEFVKTRSSTIGGGTAEIMRNIIGERILGLPGDVRVDKDRPWSEVPRS